MTTRLNGHGRRSFLGLVALFAATLVTATPAAAQEYPNRPVSIIVGFAPGGGSDLLARVIATPLSRLLGQPVIVRSAPGAGGQIAASAMLREGEDGLAILATNQPDLSVGTEMNNAPYKSTDLQVIMVDVRDPRLLLVAKGSDINSFADFVARAKAQPGKLSASAAQGGGQELFAQWLFGRLGLDVLVVGYKGGSDASNAMLAGDVTAHIGDDFARFNIRQRTKALVVGAGVTGPRWPEAQTLTAALAPLGVTPPTPDFLTRYGVYVVPSSFKKKHPASYAKLQQALLNARNSPEFQEYIARSGFQDLSIGRPGEEFDAAFAAELAEIRKLKK